MAEETNSLVLTGDKAVDLAAGPSKKAAKKAEAKAKKEALKAQRAAERVVVASADNEAEEDPAKDFYGPATAALLNSFSPGAEDVSLRAINESHVGKTVIIRAWLQNTRMQGAKMAFVELREEGNWAIQGIVTASADPKPEGDPTPICSRRMVKWVGAVNPEGFVTVEATVQKPFSPVKSCRVTDFELHISKFFVISPAPATLGMTLAAASRAVTNFSDEESTPEEGTQEKDAEGGPPAASMLTHLDNIVMHKRSPVQQAIADIRVEAKHLFRSYLREHGFKEFEPPCLIGAASEGGANVFAMPYFNQKAYLAQSPQFYKQFEIAGGRKRVFSIGPVFRAENSNTPRHMTEFTGLDMEMEIRKDYSEVLRMLEGVLLHIFHGIQKHCAAEVELIRSVYPSPEILLPEPGKEVRLTFAEAQKLLREEGPAEFRNVRDDEDMSTPQEKALGALVREKYKTDFFAVDKFPEAARPFYAKVDPTSKPTEQVTNAFDMFLRGQEILSGGERICDPDELETRIRAKGVDPTSPGIKEYIGVFREAGVPPHGGGGIGLDRVVAWYLALPSVHLAAYYPRTPKRLLP
ncbi:aspartyl-trna synthetase [Trichoderma cornu-damae]|uniref:Probable aspartate--tRNA ligase, cytoplasmic n=1 Tax=Trichoderma cornu-damae TaxID=654480 RepID=A0A9P8QE35_9HYPO|nr:aspartyl-trna synthetase [Trichoderma cornu-damae]